MGKQLKRKLTPDLVRTLLTYDTATGKFFWKKRRGGLARSGDEAGAKNARLGYVIICVAGNYVYAHRLAWFVTFDEWPAGNIDHVNGNTKDNRLCNLRICTQTQNNANAKLNKRNTSGFKGVTFDKDRNKFICRVGRHHIGRFDTAEEASDAYAKAAKSLFGEFART